MGYCSNMDIRSSSMLIFLNAMLLSLDYLYEYVIMTLLMFENNQRCPCAFTQWRYFRARCPCCASLSGKAHLVSSMRWGEWACAFCRNVSHVMLGHSDFSAPGCWLTILAVVGDLHLSLLGPHYGLRHLADGLLVSQVTMEEVAGARLLHDIRPREACHLAEAVVAVYDCTVLHPGIGYHKFPVCMELKCMCVHLTFLEAAVWWRIKPIRNQVD